MEKSFIISERVKVYFSRQASLAAISRKFKKRRVFKPAEQKMKIAYKIVKYSPSEKLLDALITLLSGAQGMVKVNERLKADPGLPRGFGWTDCARESVVKNTENR